MSALVGGDKLRRHLADLAAKLQRSPTVQVGFLKGARYPDGKSVAMVAAIQEYGAPRAGVPSRSYFRTMVSKEKSHWAADLGRNLKATHYDTDVSLGRMGLQIKGELQQSIIDIFDPPLSPVTLMLRRMQKDNPSLVVTGRVVGEAAARVKAGLSSSGVSTKPLIYSAHLLHSVDYQVVTT